MNGEGKLRISLMRAGIPSYDWHDFDGQVRTTGARPRAQEGNPLGVQANVADELPGEYRSRGGGFLLYSHPGGVDGYGPKWASHRGKAKDTLVSGTRSSES